MANNTLNNISIEATTIKNNLMSLPIGSLLKEYKICSVLSQNKTTTTYLAQDIDLHTKVVIKEYLPLDLSFRNANEIDDMFRHKNNVNILNGANEKYQEKLQHFLLKASLLAQINHPNIIKVIRFFEANETAYMVMPYESGKTLKEWWKEKNSEQHLINLLSPLLDGLQLIHDLGYLHGDIQPENIFVKSDNTFVLISFAMIKEITPEMTLTPGYVAPELNENCGPWTDIYSVGATLYWLVSGRKPPPSNVRIVDKDPILPAVTVGKGKFSPDFLRVTDWSLNLDANFRPRNINQLKRGLLIDSTTLTPETKPKKILNVFLIPNILMIKFILIMLFVSITPLLIYSYYNYKTNFSGVLNSEAHDLEVLAKNTAGRITQLIEDSRKLSNYLATDDDFVSYLNNPTENGRLGITAKLRNIVLVNPDIQFLMLMTPEGKAVSSSDPEVEGRNYKFREYFKIAMSNKPHMTGIIVGSVAGQSGIFYANPVHNSSGSVIGVIVLRIKADAINSFLKDITYNSNLTPILIDSDGIIIYYPDKNQLYRSLVTLPKNTVAKIIADQRFRRNAIDTVNMPDLANVMTGTKKQNHTFYHSYLSNKDEVIGFSPVKGQQWVIGISEPTEDLENPLNKSFHKILYSILLVSIFIILIAFLFIKNTTTAIKNLICSVELFNNKNEFFNIPVKSKDDLGTFMKKFNLMIDLIRYNNKKN